MNHLFFVKIILSTLCLLMISCEKDDICAGLDTTTPSVNITFYNVLRTHEEKAVEILECYTEDNPLKKVFYNQSSIQLPLKVSESQTAWILVNKQVINSDTITIGLDTLKFDYRVESEYISKACGYRSVFKHVKTQLNSNSSSITPGNWIISQESTNEINNSNEKHVNILF